MECLLSREQPKPRLLRLVEIGEPVHDVFAIKQLRHGTSRLLIPSRSKSLA
jgi:hypothetical protein